MGEYKMNSADDSTASRRHLEQVATETLSTFASIADKAEQHLKAGQTPGAGSLASINTLTSGQAVQSLDRIGKANQESYRHLRTEPAIARVAVVDENGRGRTYYICKATPLPSITNLASYRAPVGRLASLEVGSEFTMPDGGMVEVVEQAHFKPHNATEGWDARNTVIEGENFGPVTIESLRKLLTEVVGEGAVEDILDQLMAEENTKANIFEGVRRNVITKMGLRDQPILDKYQDEIFRLPLDKRLLILGPPGTGKTTTLIRRLGQKLDAVYLEEGEQRLVQTLAEAQGIAHANSWLMFTPTELLKQYLKEAFAREGVPAPEQQLKTWQDYRRELARNTFGVLRTSTGGGTFILKDELPSLNEDALARPVQWFEDFDAWQRKAYVQELNDATAQLAEAEVPEAKSLGERLKATVTRGNVNMAAMFSSLAREIPNVQTLVAGLKDETDRKLKASLNLHLNANKAFLKELADFIDGLQQSHIEADDQDEQDADEEDEATAASTPIAIAVATYNRVVKAQARAEAGRRPPSRTSRAGKIIEWLADRSLAESDRATVGASLLIQAAARRFLSPVKRYIGDTPKRYRSFRREQQQAGHWYRNEGFEARDIHPLELDVVLLAILRAAGELTSRPNVQREIDSAAWSSLKPVMALYRNQILVDEATDFSPIQLACMAALAHPRLRSFFACGDFNQRLTTWGARSVDEMKWVFADFDIKEVNVSYRQSRQLNELACAIIRAVGGTEQDIHLPEHVDGSGVAPALLEHASDDEVVAWLAERIREIDRYYEQLPSIAIFVNAEDAVGPMADALNANLGEHNIRVIACREGQAVGQENDVRVFDIQHIKGLEFEAVFFVGVDQLAQLHPNLFDKYLYVGTTRAATYLGVTCQRALPQAIEVLRPLFGQHWRSAG
jgi:DNA polymerase III delta prime subunit